MPGPVHPADDPAALVVSSTRAAWLATHGNHPNLVRVLGVHHVATGPRLMLEHIAGRDLAALIDAAYPQRLGLAEALAIVRDVARGLHFLHELRNEKGTAVRLIHGTVSPSLVVVGYDGVARVGGLERLAATRGAPPPGPDQAAPEQRVAGAAVDRRADVFALGALLLRVTTGLHLANGAMPVPPSQAVPHVPALVEDLIRRALAPEPAKRHATAEELRAAIDSCAVREGLHVGAEQVALMVSRLLPDIAPGSGFVPPPRPDQSLWVPSGDGAPRWLAVDSVLDSSPASSASGFDVVSVSVPRPMTLPPTPSPLVPAADAGAPTMSVTALKDSGPIRSPDPHPYPFPNPSPLANPAAMQLPLHLAMPMPLPLALISPGDAPSEISPATELVRLSDEPRRRSILGDPIFLLGVALLLFFGALLIAYFASA